MSHLRDGVPVSSTAEKSASPAEPRVYMLDSVEPFEYAKALKAYCRRLARWQGSGISGLDKTAGAKP